jgi:hypothetical protein
MIAALSVETRQERVVLETGRHRIVGEVTLPAEGFRGRLSDLLNSEGINFIPVQDAEITPHEGGVPERRAFVAVAIDHIQLAYEDSPPS